MKRSLLQLVSKKLLWWPPFWIDNLDPSLSPSLPDSHDSHVNIVIVTSSKTCLSCFTSAMSHFRRHLVLWKSVTRCKMPRNGRRKRSLSSGEESLVSYYSKHRCLDREYSPVSDTRHFKRGSSPIRSRERRHNRHLSRNRSRSTRRSNRKLRRHKYRNDPPDTFTVRSDVNVFSCFVIGRHVKQYPNLRTVSLTMAPNNFTMCFKTFRPKSADRKVIQVLI